MNNSKKIENILFIFLFLFFFWVSAFQASDNHWSAMVDQDIFHIYNSLLIYSGYEQDYSDHPAFTTFFILGGIYKFLSLFIDNFTLQEILNSENIDQYLQNLFAIARMLNSIYFFLYALLIFKILKELNIKRSLCIISTLIIISFHSIYEALFLIRSEILSMILALLAFYLLLKFMRKKENLIYCFFSGFFFCLALLAKVQVIFIIFIFALILPFLFNYYGYFEIKKRLINNDKYFIFSSIFFSLFFIGYIIFEFFFAFSVLRENYSFLRYLLSIPHHVDPLLISFFIFFYFIILKYLSRRNLINFRDTLSTTYTILFGFIFCIFFILFLDLVELTEFKKGNLLFLSNPIHLMSKHAFEMFNADFTGKFDFANIFQIIKDMATSNDKLWPNKKFTIEIGGILIGILDIFRFLITLISALFIFFIIIFRKSEKILPIMVLLLFGITILIISFSSRYSYGYNIYLYPLFLILVAIGLNQFKNKNYTAIIFSIILISSLVEFYLLRDFYKFKFARENRIYEICKIKHWKNSENYIKNMNINSFVPLSTNPKTFLSFWIPKMNDEFFSNYCNQLEQKASWKTNFFNIKFN